MSASKLRTNLRHCKAFGTRNVGVCFEPENVVAKAQSKHLSVRSVRWEGQHNQCLFQVTCLPESVGIASAGHPHCHPPNTTYSCPSTTETTTQVYPTPVFPAPARCPVLCPLSIPCPSGSSTSTASIAMGLAHPMNLPSHRT